MHELAMRGLMQHLTGLGGFSPTPGQFAALATTLTAMATAGGNSSTSDANCTALQGVRLSIEAHEHQVYFGTRALPILEELRRGPVGRCCAMVVSTRVREALQWYLSVWQWGGEPLYGRSRTVFQWAPPNLQTVLLRKGDFGPRKKWLVGIRSHTAGVVNLSELHEWPDYSMDAERYRRTRDLLLHRYDVAAPLERFNDAMRVICDRLGLPTDKALPLMTNHVIVPTHNHANLVGSPSRSKHGTAAGEDQKYASMLAAREEDVYSRYCFRHRAECDAMVSERAAFDRQLYHAINASFSARFTAWLASKQASPPGAECDGAHEHGGLADQAQSAAPDLRRHSQNKQGPAYQADVYVMRTCAQCKDTWSRGLKECSGGRSSPLCAFVVNADPGLISLVTPL